MHPDHRMTHTRVDTLHSEARLLFLTIICSSSPNYTARHTVTSMSLSLAARERCQTARIHQHLPTNKKTLFCRKDYGGDRASSSPAGAGRQEGGTRHTPASADR